jgi:thiol-disulfide isomerase/thioredoxin
LLLKKLFPLLLLSAFATNAAAQSGRKIIRPPTQTEPPIQAPLSSQPEAAPAARAESGALPVSLLQRPLKSLDKGSFRLADFGGKVVVVNLWASWCGPCRMEIPEYEKVRKEYAGREVEFIGLTTEDPRTSSDRVKQFARNFNFGFRLGWADRETALTLMNGGRAIPQTLVIGRDGRIVSQWSGYSRGHSGDRLRDTIERALSHQADSTPWSAPTYRRSGPPRAPHGLQIILNAPKRRGARPPLTKAATGRRTPRS